MTVNSQRALFMRIFFWHALSIMSKVSFTFALFTLLLISSGCQAEQALSVKEEGGLTVISAPEEMKACSVDNDCITKHSDCNHCCSSEAINKEFSDVFDTEKRTICDRQESRMVCNCISLVDGVKCIEGICTLITGSIMNNEE